MTPTFHGINLQVLVMLSGFSAVIAPYFAAFLTRNHFKPVLNSIIVWLVCAIMGAASYVASGATLDNSRTLPALLAAVSAVFTGAKLFYLKLGYKDPFLTWLQGIGEAVKTPRQTAPATTPPLLGDGPFTNVAPPAEPAPAPVPAPAPPLVRPGSDPGPAMSAAPVDLPAPATVNITIAPGAALDAATLTDAHAKLDAAAAAAAGPVLPVVEAPPPPPAPADA